MRVTVITMVGVKVAMTSRCRVRVSVKIRGGVGRRPPIRKLLHKSLYHRLGLELYLDCYDGS